MHSPKPWKAERRTVYSDRFACHVYACAASPWTPDEELDANVRLIKAAPDLLEACQGALKLIREAGFIAGSSTIESPLGRANNLLVAAISKVE